MVRLNLKNLVVVSSLISVCCNYKVGLNYKTMIYYCLKCKKRCKLKTKIKK